jgi:hypothetical protein
MTLETSIYDISPGWRYNPYQWDIAGHGGSPTLPGNVLIIDRGPWMLQRPGFKPANGGGFYFFPTCQMSSGSQKGQIYRKTMVLPCFFLPAWCPEDLPAGKGWWLVNRISERCGLDPMVNTKFWRIKKTTQIYPNGKKLEWFIVAFTTSN